MEKEYYRPEEEDIYIGCILEHRAISYRSVDRVDFHPWKKIIVDFDFMARGYSESGYDSSGEIRMWYLTKEDIESLGWVLTEPSVGAGAAFYEKKDDYWTYTLSQFYGPAAHKIRIQRRSHEQCEVNGKFTVCKIYGDVLYQGKCLSINELRKIQKWLEIA